ncbi:MAG: carbohydrate ABC transporter permease [Actinobacteria bacterium]|nr:MAG: carbohydrate ABC transporter permease [Actinomycetota bacterium]
MSTEDLPPIPPLAAAEELAREGEAAKGGPATTTGIPGRERAERIRSVIAYTVMFLVAALFAIPFLWSVSTSFRTLADTLGGFSLLPRHWTTSGYHEAFHTFNFGRYTLNSAIIAGAITVSNLFLASLGGYAFARLKFPGREVLFMLVLGTLMIPDQLRLVPIYLMLVNWIPSWVGHLGFHNASFVNRNGVILIQLVSASSLFLMRQYFLTIPRDLEEAAKLDGASYFKTYRKVMLPLAGPALAAVGILTFQGSWNGLFWPAILLQDRSQFTIPIGIANFRFAYTTLWPPLMAASVLAILPILALFIVFQRYFVAGVAAAGVKG